MGAAMGSGVIAKDGNPSMWWHDCKGGTVEYLGTEIPKCPNCGFGIPDAAKDLKNENPQIDQD